VDNEFEKHAQGKSSSVIGELFGFMRANKKWWLLPLVVVMLLLFALVTVGGTGAAPFIYTLF
jgi:hypothetical protein